MRDTASQVLSRPRHICNAYPVRQRRRVAGVGPRGVVILRATKRVFAEEVIARKNKKCYVQLFCYTHHVLAGPARQTRTSLVLHTVIHKMLARVVYNSHILYSQLVVISAFISQVVYFPVTQSI